MIELFSANTPNGWKISIMLEEIGYEYKITKIDLDKGEQFKSNFKKISPLSKIPVIIDHKNKKTIFESGAILLYLADKTKKFIPSSKIGRKQVIEWLFWQVGNLGPMAGQHSHFWNYAPELEKNSYAAVRYAEEYDRCFEVLERQLEGRHYIVDEYSIADIICWPWILIAKSMGRSLDSFPNVTNWRLRIKERPALRKGVDLMRKKRIKRINIRIISPIFIRLFALFI